MRSWPAPIAAHDHKPAKGAAQAAVVEVAPIDGIDHNLAKATERRRGAWGAEAPAGAPHPRRSGLAAPEQR